ncbi:hypothetical protein D2E66_21465 [Mycobacteroides abscessus]|nr:hypothetical protein D2E66_21465 [Mycobacteroides abscessus]
MRRRRSRRPFPSRCPLCCRLFAQAAHRSSRRKRLVGAQRAPCATSAKRAAAPAPRARTDRWCGR